MIGDVIENKRKRKKHIGMTEFKNVVVSNGKGKVVVL